MNNNSRNNKNIPEILNPFNQWREANTIMEHGDVILWIFSFTSKEKEGKNLSRKFCYLDTSYAEEILFSLFPCYCEVLNQLYGQHRFPYIGMHLWATFHWKKWEAILSSRFPGVQWNVLPWTDCYTIQQASDCNKTNYLKISDSEYYVTIGPRVWVDAACTYSVNFLCRWVMRLKKVKCI